MDAPNRLQDFLVKIAALHQVNEEIIQRITEHEVVNIADGYVYHVVFEEASAAGQCGKFSLETTAVERSGKLIIERWRVPSTIVTITPISDLFNDKINYNVSDFASLKRLNDEMFYVRRYACHTTSFNAFLV